MIGHLNVDVSATRLPVADGREDLQDVQRVLGRDEQLLASRETFRGEDRTLLRGHSKKAQRRAQPRIHGTQA